MAKPFYITGYKVKPSYILPNGQVIFNDVDFVDVVPNQKQCEAYGYTYDKATGTCYAYNPNVNLGSILNNTGNLNNGAGNTNGIATNNIQINGTNNSTVGYNRSCIINGNANQTSVNVENAMVSGNLAEATATNSFVLGGNGSTDNLGERQNITLMFGTQTTDNTVSDSYLNNTSGSYFAIPENTIIAFQSETVAVRIGGTGGGNPGDFKAFIETGVAINESGTLSIDKSRSTIANTGTTSGWVCDLTVSGTNLVQTVKGANNRTLMWATTIRMTQIKTGVAL
tara:strand:+ start:5139 stop:5987 length:849 start_codon:yes stop_codon:yes gene_type:complete